MAYKSILTILSDPIDVGPVLEAALPFARANGAHLDVLCLGIDRTQTGYYAAGTAALVTEHTMAMAREEADRLEEAARLRLARTEVPWTVENIVAQNTAVSAVVAERARFTDIVILPRPYGQTRSFDAPAVIEAALFQGRAPVIVLPEDDTPLEMPKRITLAWNESIEAMTAARQALPLLAAADEVDLLIVDPAPHSADRADPGSELSKLLTRHGAKVTISVIPKTTHRISDIIERHAVEQNADLLVMGAYGHSRFREAILGGATRNLLEQASLPVLMAH